MGSKPVIGATKKGPKKRTHTDPYAGGQASGKQAQPDARQPKRPRMSGALTVEDLVASSLMSDAGLDLPQEPAQVEAIYELCHPDAGPPEVPTNSDVRSPEEALLEALALYNAIFPPSRLTRQPVIAVQATRNAYYREHLYN